MSQPPLPTPAPYTCPHCGAGVEEQAPFCPECGAAMQAAKEYGHSGGCYRTVLTIALAVVALYTGLMGGCMVLVSLSFRGSLGEWAMGAGFLVIAAGCVFALTRLSRRHS